MHTETVPVRSQTARTARPLGALAGVRLVAVREILVTVRSKAFIVSFLISMVFVGGGVLLGGLLIPALAGEAPRVAVTAETEAAARAAELEVVRSGSAEQAVQAVRDGEADIAVLPASAFAGLELHDEEGGPAQLSPGAEFFLVGDEEGDSGVSRDLSIVPDTFLLQQPERAPWIGIVLPGLFGLLYFTTVMGYASAVSVSVVEEKATRIVEILLSTLSPRTIMAGKVLGMSTIALAQSAGMLGPLLAAGAVLGILGAVPAIAPALFWYALFFVVGFLLVASLYAAAGATVSRQEEVGSATMPLMFLIMVPYILSFLAGQNETLMTVMSYVPLSSPIAMPSRVALGAAEWWEPLLSFALLVGTALACIPIGARIYENSVLRTGQRVTLREALRRAE